MPQPKPNQNERYNYAQYLTWDDGDRWELIDGEAFCMSPGPGRQHQKLSVALTNLFYNHLQGKTSEVYAAPFDVRFVDTDKDVPDEYIENVVQPDILIVCDPKKLDEKGVKGAPDLVIEILSPSSARNDMIVKYQIYERFGVNEYWVVHPFEQLVQVFKLQDNAKYGVPDRYGIGDVIPVGLLGDLKIDMNQVFLLEKTVE